MVRLPSHYEKPRPSDHMIEVKKNERVAGDLEEKKALLAKTKMELDELQSSKVGRRCDFNRFRC